jgi:hypothetical protein
MHGFRARLGKERASIGYSGARERFAGSLPPLFDTLAATGISILWFKIRLQHDENSHHASGKKSLVSNLLNFPSTGSIRNASLLWAASIANKPCGIASVVWLSNRKRQVPSRAGPDSGPELSRMCESLKKRKAWNEDF